MYTVKYVSPSEALSIIELVTAFLYTAVHTPTYLLKHLAEEAPRLRDVEAVFITVYGDIYINQP